jgi:hypothetical protein
MAQTPPTEFTVRKFNINSMQKNRACIFIGGSGTGKSSLVTAVLYHNRDIPAGIVCSGTELGDPHFAKFIPDIFIYNDWAPDKVEDLIQVQQRRKKAIDAIDVNIEYCKRNRRLDDVKALEARKAREMVAMRKFIIIDDCMYKPQITRSSTMRLLCMNGRHYGILTLITVQYAISLDIALRGNAGYIFICREPIVSYRKKIYESFVGMLPNFHMFERVMDATTQNFECLVVDRTTRSTKPEDNLFWFRAEKEYNFRIGSDRLWQYHRQNYDPEHEEKAHRERKARKQQGLVRKGK